MSKFNFNLNNPDAVEGLESQFYTGPTPPAGVYLTKVKRFQITTNRKEDYMLKVLTEVQESGEAKKFNGYGIWNNLNITNQGRPWLDNFLSSVLDPKGVKAFHDGKISTDDESPANILRVATTKVIGKFVKTAARMGDFQGQSRLEVVQYLAPGETTDEEDEAVEDEAGTAEEDEELDVDESSNEDEAGTAEEDEDYSEDELKELDLSDLREVAEEEFGLKASAKAKKATLIKNILAAQEDSSDDENDSAESEDSATELTEDELKELSKDELMEMIEDNDWEMPRPPVKSRLVKAILEAQSEPPF